MARVTICPVDERVEAGGVGRLQAVVEPHPQLELEVVREAGDHLAQAEAADRGPMKAIATRRSTYSLIGLSCSTTRLVDQLAEGVGLPDGGHRGDRGRDEQPPQVLLLPQQQLVHDRVLEALPGCPHPPDATHRGEPSPTGWCKRFQARRAGPRGRGLPSGAMAITPAPRRATSAPRSPTTARPGTSSGAGTGPAVIVMAEMPGISPKVHRVRRPGRRHRLHRGDAPPVRRARATTPTSAGTPALLGYMLSSIVPGVHQPGVRHVRLRPARRRYRLAPRPRRGRARALRRARRRRHRHVLHRRLRAGHGRRRPAARAGAVAAVDADRRRRAATASTARGPTSTR